MNKFLKSLLLFFIINLIVYAFLLFVWGHVFTQKFKPNLIYLQGSYGHTYTRFKEVKTKKNIDILFLGSSHAYRGFDPRIFKDYITFNLGTSSQTPIQTKILLDRYLTQLNPKIIIYAISPNAFIGDGVESSLDIISNDKNDWNSIKLALEINHIKVYNTLIYSFEKELLNLNRNFFEPQKKGEDLYISGGFVEKKNKYYSNQINKNKKWDFNPESFKHFEKILLLLKKRNIKLILVKTPTTNSLYNSYTNNEFFDRKMSTYGKYYNFNKILQLDDSLDFYDANHLNQNGVKIFNKKLVEILDLN